MNRLVTSIFFSVLFFTACAKTENNASPIVEFEHPVSSAGLDGESLISIKCLKCHDLSRIEKTERTEEEWQKILAKMTSFGVSLKSDEKEVLIEYLAYKYGPE